jgi:hypothetical protein
VSHRHELSWLSPRQCLRQWTDYLRRSTMCGNTFEYVAQLRRVANSGEDISVNRATSGYGKQSDDKAPTLPYDEIFHRQPLSSHQGARIATPMRIAARSSPVARSLHLKIFLFTVPWLSSSVCLTEQLAGLCSQIFVSQLTNPSVKKLISYKPALFLL